MKRTTSYLSLAGIALAFSLATPALAAPAATTADMMRALQSSTASPVEQVHWRRHWHRRHCGWVRTCWRGRWGRLHCRPVYRCGR